MHTRTLALSLLLLAACTQAPEAPSTPFAAQSASEDTGAVEDASEDSSGSGSGAADATPDTEGSADFTPEFQSTLGGTWLHLSQVSSCVYFTNYSEQYSKTIYVVRTEQDGFGVLTERWEGCSNSLTPVYNVQPNVTPAILETSHRFTTTGLFDGTSSADFFGTSRVPRLNRVGDGYASGPLVELWGVQMDDPLRDAFPTDIADPRISDTDGDGNPAVTLKFSTGCDAYLAQRTSSYHQGNMIASDRMKGRTISATRQLVVDATAILCKAGYELTANPGRSGWERVRIDGEGGARNADLNSDGNITCEEALTISDNLFSIVPLDNECCDPRKSDKACCNPDVAANTPCCDPVYARANRDICPPQ
jgi:hypothetical protein